MNVMKAGPIRSFRLAAVTLTALLALGGCRESITELTPDSPATSRGRRASSPASSVAWEATGRALITRYNPGPPAASRQLAYLGLAQYAAVVNAEKHAPRPRSAVRGAVAGASASVLAHFFPADAAMLDSLVWDQAPSAPGSRRHFLEGEALGRRVAESVIARALADRYDAVFTGTIPTGPGYWSSSANPPAPPTLPLLGQMKPFFLDSGDQYRPGPPPAFGSAEYLAGLDEVRQVALSRTPEQVRIAKFWALGAGTSLPPGYWNEIAGRLVTESRLDEREAARAFLLVNGAMIDALIAGHDAKYAYWFVRPTKADPSITLAIGLPNHPSYPSTHTSLSKSAAGVLGRLFPRHRKEVAALAEEASISRLYGGIHYRFDLEAGTEIAHGVVESTMRGDRKAGLVTLVR